MSRSAFPRFGVLPEVEHLYGPRVGLIDDPVARTLLARLCAATTQQPEIHRLIEGLYRRLLDTVVGAVFPRVETTVTTRMAASMGERGTWSGTVVNPATPTVIGTIARAGVLPSVTCFAGLCEILDPSRVRQDYFGVGRTTDPQHKVTGAAVTYSKVGGPIAGTHLLIPDPMGATGGTLLQTLDAYRRENAGDPARILALHLIITPEYIRRVLEAEPNVEIFAYRVDRGMSDPEVQAATPGRMMDREFGLNALSYIVPGAGGLGEIMTNSFV